MEIPDKIKFKKIVRKDVNEKASYTVTDVATTMAQVRSYMLYERRLSPYNTKKALELLKKILKVYQELTPSKELGYRIEEDLRAKGRRPRTIRNHLAVVELWAAAMKVVDENGQPLKFKMPRVEGSRNDSLKPEEARALLDYGALSLRDNAILHLMLFCCLRPKEVINADVEDVDLIERKFIVRSKYDTDIKSPGTKSKRERDIPMSKECTMALKTYLEEGRPNIDTKALFFSNHGNRIAIRTLQDMVRAAARRAGIKRKVYPYLCRHSGCTLMLTNNVNMIYVNKIMGHSTMDQTKAYSHPEWSAMKENIDKNYVI